MKNCPMLFDVIYGRSLRDFFQLLFFASNPFVFNDFSLLWRLWILLETTNDRLSCSTQQWGFCSSQSLQNSYCILLPRSLNPFHIYLFKNETENTWMYVTLNVTFFMTRFCDSFFVTYFFLWHSVTTFKTPYSRIKVSHITYLTRTFIFISDSKWFHESWLCKNKTT